MPKLFSSFRVAPGVRLSTSPRGLRAHVGPRGLRAHVGGGRAGVSTGAGPVTVYQPVGGRSSLPAAAGPASTPAQRHEAARQAWARIDQLHRVEFAGVTRQVAALPALPAFGTLLATAEKQALTGVRLWDRAARKAAREQARTQAEAWAGDLLALAERDRQERQRELDDAWDALMCNDPDVVHAAAADALARRGLPARVVDVDDGWVHLVVVGPAPHELPTEKPTLTAGGAPTTARLNKSDLADATNKTIAARVVLAVRQCVAVAPNLAGLRVVVDAGDGTPLLAATFVPSLPLVTNSTMGPWETLKASSTELLVKPSGRTGELGALRLAAEPAYDGILQH